MKTLKNIFAALFLITFATTASFAQTNVSASAQTEATIITPLAITKNADLNFGNIVAGAAGSVVVGTDGTRSSTGGVTLPTATPGTITAAEFTVTGLAAATYAITLPAAFNVTSSGSNTMLVNTFVTNPTPTGTLDGSGSEVLKVGATLNVEANQAAGTYTNSNGLLITVAYN